MKPTPAPQRHCPACRRSQPVKTLGRVVVRGEPYDAVECLQETCQLRWLVSLRPTLREIGAAA